MKAKKSTLLVKDYAPNHATLTECDALHQMAQISLRTYHHPRNRRVIRWDWRDVACRYVRSLLRRGLLSNVHLYRGGSHVALHRVNVPGRPADILGPCLGRVIESNR